MSREVLRLRGTLDRNAEWDVMVDMFIYREPEEEKSTEKAEEQAKDNSEDPPEYGWENPAADKEWAGEVPVASGWDSQASWGDIPNADS